MSLWIAKQPLVLASQSSVRRNVLSAAGIPLEISPADIDERGMTAAADLDDPGDVAALLPMFGRVGFGGRCEQDQSFIIAALAE